MDLIDIIFSILILVRLVVWVCLIPGILTNIIMFDIILNKVKKYNLNHLKYDLTLTREINFDDIIGFLLLWFLSIFNAILFIIYIKKELNPIIKKKRKEIRWWLLKEYGGKY